MDNFFVVARQVVMLFILIGAGVICRRAKLVDEFSVRGLINVLLLIVTPALIIDSFQRPFDPAMLCQLGLAFVIATAIHGGLMALAYATVRGGEKTRPVLRTATVFSNAGFMGIPLQQALFGADGVFYGSVYVAMFNVFIWTWGLHEMQSCDDRIQASSTGGLMSFLKALVNPGTVGLVIGLPLFVFSVPLPEMVARPVHMMADLNTPLAMLVIGYYLAGANFKPLLGYRAFYTASFMRLVVTPLLLLAALYLVRTHLDRMMMLAMVTAACAPVAATVAIFAAKYKGDVDLSVGLVSGTTLLSSVTMPAVIAIAMAVL